MVVGQHFREVRLRQEGTGKSLKGHRHYSSSSGMGSNGVLWTAVQTEVRKLFEQRAQIRAPGH